MVYLDFWKKTFTYRGRDKKREFWLPFLVNILIGIGLFVFVKLTHSSLTYLPLFWAGLAFIPTILCGAPHAGLRHAHDLLFDSFNAYFGAFGLAYHPLL